MTPYKGRMEEVRTWRTEALNNGLCVLGIILFCALFYFATP